jgi:DNA polymerase-1
MRSGGDALWLYNAQDCARTFEIWEAQQKAIDALHLRGPHDFEMDLFYPVLRTMTKGCRVDERKRVGMLDRLQAAEVEGQAWLEKVIGHPINIQSPKQIAEFFYSEMGQSPYHNRKTGGVTTDDEALEKIGLREPLLLPIVQKIQELRSLGVFTGTFLKSLTDQDGRLRCAYNIGGTITFRFSSSENVWGNGTNLQNWSKGGGLLPNLREIIIPDEGFTFFDIDLAAADLRIVAWESNCQKMKEWFRDGKDPYTEITRIYYKDGGITKADPRRQLFKSFCHGTNYGGRAKNLAQRLGLHPSEAERAQAWYFAQFPEIRAWQLGVIATVNKTSRVHNAFGFSCTFFDRVDENVYRDAFAWIGQSTTAIVINSGYLRLYRDALDIDVLLQVHDSLAGQFPTSDKTAVGRIKECCEIEIPFPGDPLVIPVGIKTSEKSWGDCE